MSIKESVSEISKKQSNKNSPPLVGEDEGEGAIESTTSSQTLLQAGGG